MRDDLTRGCSNYYGPLKPSEKARIAHFFEEPGVETWNGMKNIVIAPNKRFQRTVWLAVVAKEPRYGHPGSTAVPDEITVARAIRDACRIDDELKGARRRKK